ncbi:M23 family metallopeptidase [Virgibacillus sp. LDC-1]|uniref:M23 family metallopeptidase n=1 Tax=Virgibacillus sp. LDC-1 TaxID=3039856 RepID=UPI0024DE7CCB|nr:M23 family metallopeptidase [Virgibacillus sp. LDC-1]
MKEENNTPKNKWRQLFRKKWFFPAVYLVIAALLLSVVIWYQNLDNQIPEAGDDKDISDNYTPSPYDEDAEAVLDQQEVIKMPVTKETEAEIVTKFFDYSADQEDQVNALILHNSRYYQSTGVDLAAANGDPFDVTASLSGTVMEVKEDPLLGNVVVLEHGSEVMTYYASLDGVKVKAGQKVKQGDLLGVAGKNIFGKDNGNHVHFELRKAGKVVNPETYFNQPVSKLDSAEAENVTDEATEESEKNDQANEQQETNTEENGETTPNGKQKENTSDPTNQPEEDTSNDAS